MWPRPVGIIISTFCYNKVIAGVVPDILIILITMSDTKITYSLSRGPGGQRRDKKKTGVRLYHVPSGIVVQVDDQRLQTQNKKIAFQILAQKLKKLSRRKKKRILTKVPRYAKEKRLENKKQLSVKKKLRRVVSDV